MKIRKRYSNLEPKERRKFKGKYYHFSSESRTREDAKETGEYNKHKFGLNYRIIKGAKRGRTRKGGNWWDLWIED